MPSDAGIRPGGWAPRMKLIKFRAVFTRPLIFSTPLRLLETIRRTVAGIEDRGPAGK